MSDNSPDTTALVEAVLFRLGFLRAQLLKIFFAFSLHAGGQF